MANTGKPADKGGKPKELSMEARLGIAFALMTAVLFLTPYFVKTTTPPAKTKQAAAPAKDAKAAQQPASTPAAPAPPPSEPPPAGQIAAESQNDYLTVDTDVYSARFSNKGATLRSLVLKKYNDAKGKPVELVNSRGGQAVGFPFSLVSKAAVDPDPNRVLFRAAKSADGLGVTFEYADAKIYARKSFEFEKGRYRVLVTSELREQGSPVSHVLAWRGGFGDFSVLNTLSTQHTIYFDNANNKLNVNEVSAAKSGTAIVSGNFRFAGLEDTYFTAVALPTQNQNMEVQTWSDRILFEMENKEEPHIGVAIGGEAVNRFNMFVGPKDPEVLKAVDPRLEQVVDYGWFEIIAKPLFSALHYVQDHYTHNWGWAIILVTVIINVLMVPLKISNLQSMKKMAAIQPQIKALNDKYAGLSMRDPKKQQQQQEMMDLYKKHGVNPMGGCLPMLLQLPFFFAFYKVLTVAIELRGAPWLWVSDLSQPETLAIRVLPLATVATQFVLQKMTPVASADPQQQRIMQLMPLMFIFIFYSVSSGLVLYWLTGNVVGIAQQWFFNRTMHAAPGGGTGKPGDSSAPKKIAKK
jgi:YidC/Oxa1 family membrane protein insertase